MRARIAAACAGAALAGGSLAGCGAGSGDDARPRSTTRPAPAPITIDEPTDGQALRGRELEDGSLRLRARVRGRAQPGGTVFLNASCVPVPCTAQAFVQRSGRWSASLDLMTPATGRFVAIDANAQEGVVASGSAVATVELVSANDARSAIQRDAAQAREAPPAQKSSRKPPALQRDVLLIGDSLAVGMADALQEALPRWRVRVDAKISRPLAEGMRVFGSERQAPAIVAFSLFTNDDPRSTGALESAVRASASRPGGCAIWATIAAPPVKGVDYGAANQLLRTLATDPDLALSLQIVDWSAAVAKSPSLIARDGVHATAAGYRARGRLFADAIKACAGAR
jgi:hypothetical protein